MTAHPSVAEFRAHFPALADTTYLASCSQGALSDAMTAALLEFQFSIREHGAPWELWMGKVAEARAGFARHIGADVDEVAVVSTASEGAFHVASTQDWSTRPRLVTTDMEFPSVAHVWLAQRPRGAEVVHVPDRDGVVEPQRPAAAGPRGRRPGPRAGRQDVRRRLPGHGRRARRRP
ncbi:hypothetical protein GCM10023162_23160 [Klenkia terrae]